MGRRVKQVPPALVLADKPEDMGSAALVARLRSELDGARVGHAGTLDRFATGLMLLLAGQATALADVLLHQDKTYLATFELGRATDTHDPVGETLAERPRTETLSFMEENRERIYAALAEIQRRTEQIPPAYSALKHKGKRFSDLARSGTAILPAARPVRIHELAVTEYNTGTGRIQARIDVSSGTYIRAIARDLGECIDYPAHLAALRRLRIGGMSLEDPDVWRPDQGAPVTRSLLGALPDWPRQTAAEARFADIQNGRQIGLELQLAAGTDFFITGSGDRLLAWGRADGRGGYEYRRVFSDEIKKGFKA